MTLLQSILTFVGSDFEGWVTIRPLLLSHEASCNLPDPKTESTKNEKSVKIKNRFSIFETDSNCPLLMKHIEPKTCETHLVDAARLLILATLSKYSTIMFGNE